MRRIKELKGLKGLKDNESYLLDPLSCPHVVNIVESISVVNNVSSSFRVNNVNV